MEASRSFRSTPREFLRVCETVRGHGDSWKPGIPVNGRTARGAKQLSKRVVVVASGGIPWDEDGRGIERAGRGHRGKDC